MHARAYATVLAVLAPALLCCGRTQDISFVLDAEVTDAVPQEDAQSSDARIDGGRDAQTGCVSGQTRCVGGTLQICLNGTYENREECSYGCTETPTPHCGNPVWPNQVTTQDMEAGIEDVELRPGDLVVDTDTGLISGPGAPIALPIRIVDRSDIGLADLMIFSFRSLRIRSGAHVRVVGSRIPVFAAQGNISVEGTLDVSAAPDGTGGPGGYDGGSQGGRGFGPGAGSSGLIGPLRVQEGGGGGAGFGATGGPGGPTSTAQGGQAGSPYGNPKLDPIVGGSGGGSGARGDQSIPGGGGGGGGAIALMSLTGVAVLTEGAVLAQGGGGFGGGTGDAGGGGGSGGGILIAAPQVQLLGLLAANGGAGGGADTEPPEQGQPGQASDQPAAPGTGGGAGGAGTNPQGQQAEEASLHGAGGGGGCGRIRIESRDAPVIGGILSPALETPQATMVALPVE